MLTTATIEVEVISLDRLLRAHEPIPIIDFLKIDAEGSEVSIIQSAAFTQYRPRIILIEINGFGIYDPVLRSKAYHRVWFDGLNRFCVREEDVWRANLVARPISVWDNAKPAQLERLEAEVKRMEGEVKQMEAEVKRMKATLSWRFTAPLRLFGGLPLTCVNGSSREVSANTASYVKRQKADVMPPKPGCWMSRPYCRNQCSGRVALTGRSTHLRPTG